MAEKTTENLADLRLYQDQATQPQRIIFVKDLRVDAFIGAYEEEMGQSQPIIINIEMQVTEPSNPVSDQLEDVVCYNRIVKNIDAILGEGHIKLVETLAERIAAMCLAHPMGLSARVRVDKPNAIAAAAGAGVEILRHKKR
ncbi:dihydroneopterin aldolase [Parvularcula sp. IMCC14364]|uniref:dihydroneopterin aldolase n=1 Tax=Parvularcula sp. IMCC14364 TaxID=3067902 RepID=UPI00274151C8|nr:dihydroneopterin aldolase [Parvularcula sp. IMCC14364]